MRARKLVLMIGATLATGALLVGCQQGSGDKTQELERRVQELERQQASPQPTASPEIVDVSPEATPQVAPQPVPRTGRRPAPQGQMKARSAPSTSSRQTASGSTAPSGTTPTRTEPVERIDEREAGTAEDDWRETGDPGPRREAASAPTSERAVIPAGTQLTLRLETPVSSKASHVGDRVVARVERAVSDDGSVVLPGGTVLNGRVTEAESSGRVKGRARVTVDFDRIVVRGRSQALDATTISAIAPDTHERDAKVIGGSAVAGAIIGGLKGGKSGAAKGAVIGAGAGTTAVLVTKGKDVELPAGSRWVVRVRNAVRL